MNNFNNIPSQGTFGRAVEKMNANFALTKSAIDELEYSARKNKGLFQNVTALMNAVPFPKVGDWATVQSTAGTLDEQTTISYTGSWRDEAIGFTIPQGATIYLAGDLESVSGRNAVGDTTYQTLVNGSVAEFDINYIRGGENAASVTIGYSTETDQTELFPCPVFVCRTAGIWNDSGQTYEGDILDLASYVKTTDLNTEVSALEDSIDAVRALIEGVSTTESVTFTAAYQQKALTHSIPQGATIYLSGDVSRITCRTTSEESEAYQVVYNGTVAEKEINYIKCNDTYGSCTIQAFSSEGLEQNFVALENEVQSLASQVDDAKTGSYQVKREMVSAGLIKPMKILAIGNSWSLNATYYLGEILAELNIPVKIGVCYAGGASLQQYWNNVLGNVAAYEYHTWENGTWSRPTTLRTLDYVLAQDKWDIITHQQQSNVSGVYSSYQPYLHDLIAYEKTKLKTYPMFALHATWAYPSTNETEDFETYYGSDTTTMYNAVLNAYNTAMAAEGIGFVMPSTPMIQQVRSISGITGIDTSDGTHLSTHGFYAAGCVWAEMLLRNYFTYAEDFIADGVYKVGTLTDEQAASIRSLAATIVSNVATYFSNYNNDY